MGNAPYSVHARALRRAADILGGKHQLRVALRVPMARLEDWLAGKSIPPMDVFLKAVDVISTPTANHTPTAAHVRARILAQQSGELIEKTNRTIARSQERPRQQLPTVSRFFEGAFSGQNCVAILDAALDAAIEATRAQMGNVQLKSERGLEIVTYRGFDTPFLEFFACVSDGHGAACGAALKTGGRVIVSNVASDPIFHGTEAARVMEQASARACQSTPLVSPSGQLLGMLSTHFDHPHQPANEELALVDQIVERAVFWLEEAKA
ncbi:MAG: GAF domain-containing protein [Betaproteobacteria bacterium]|nr:GAF domain-containing protein [Betaproteobacteria bacterium]